MRHSPRTVRPDTLLCRLHRLGVHDGGATAVVAAILFPVVVGGLGLGAETGYWYLTQRKLQHVADVSAHAAGARLRADDSDEQITAAARHVASESGYKGSPALVVNTAYTHEDHPGAKLVEVVATEVQPRLFSAVVAGLFSSDPETTVTISARAVGMVDGGAGTVACVLALSATASRAINSSATAELEGCDVASNSNNATDSLYVTQSLTTDCAYTVGKASATGLNLTRCPEVKEYAPLTRDPYADVPEPNLDGIACDGPDKYGKPNTPEPPLEPAQTLDNGVKVMRFCAGLDAKGTVDFGPGLYVMDGPLKMTSSNTDSILQGSGVTFYFTGDHAVGLRGTRLNLAAPTSGPYSGLLVFGNRGATTASHEVGGNTDSVMTGAIYAPTASITVTGNAKIAENGCTQVIGNTVTLSGNSNLQSDCDGAGTSDIATGEIVRIIE